MNEMTLATELTDLFTQLRWSEDNGEEFGLPLEGELRDVSTFEDRMLLTLNKGVILEFKDGSEFQMTIVCSARPSGDSEEDE